MKSFFASMRSTRNAVRAEMRPSVKMYAVVSSWPSVASTPYSTMMVGSAVIIMLWEIHAAAVPDIMMPSTSVRFPLGAPERRACDRAFVTRSAGIAAESSCSYA